MTKRCVDCRFFVKTTERLWGKCGRYPEHIGVMNTKHWCGEFSPRDEAKTLPSDYQTESTEVSVPAASAQERPPNKLGVSRKTLRKMLEKEGDQSLMAGGIEFYVFGDDPAPERERMWVRSEKAQWVDDVTDVYVVCESDEPGSELWYRDKNGGQGDG